MAPLEIPAHLNSSNHADIHTMVDNVVFTWDGTNVTSYVNGVAGATDTTTGGTLVNAGTTGYIGYIDTFGSDDLTAAEVLELCNQGKR